MDTNERVTLVVEAVTKGFNKLRDNVLGFTHVMKQNMPQFKQQARFMNQWSNAGAKAAGRFRLMMHGMRGFRMEMLSVLFFGMALQRMFMGLLRPAFEVAGIFDIISTILQLVFLPIAMALLDPLLALLDFFINLPEETKILIGKLILLGLGLGTAFLAVGVLTLGIGGLINAFGGLLGIVERLFPEPLGDVAAAIVGIGAVSSAIDILVPIFQSIRDLVGDLWNKLIQVPEIKELMDKFGISVENLKNPFSTLEKSVGDAFDELAERLGIEEEWKEFKKNVKDMSSNFSELWNKIKDIDLAVLVKSIKKLANAVTDTLIPAIDTLIKWLGKLLDLSDRIGFTDFIKDILNVVGRNPEAALVGTGVGALTGNPFVAAAGGAVLAKLSDVLTGLSDDLTSLRLPSGERSLLEGYNNQQQIGNQSTFIDIPQGISITINSDMDSTIRTVGEE